MCIAIYKMPGAQMPGKDVLKTCFNNNPDGCGFAYSDGENVIIRKGFMEFDKFYKALKKAKSKSFDGSFLIHFRISTQGGVNPENCHPFPLSDKTEDLKAVKTASDIAIIHNGIIDLTTEWGYRWKTNAIKNAYSPSDTALFIRDYLSLIISGENRMNYWKNSNTVKLIGKLIDSKMAIMDKTGHCELIGKWYLVNGVWFSNETYKPAVKKYSVTEAKIESKTSSVSKPYVIGNSFDDYDNKNSIKTAFDFDPIDCPFAIDEDDAYCEDCSNCYNCWGYTGIESKRENDYYYDDYYGYLDSANYR